MKKLIATLLSICTLFGVCAAAGCGGDDQAPAPVSDGKILLNGFENNADLDTVLMYGMLGIVSVNKDEAYIKEGEGSAKIMVESDPFLDGAPYLFQATALTERGLDYTEFSKTGYITFDLYNAQDSEREIALQLVHGDRSSGLKKWITLQSGWNEIRYVVDRTYIPASAGTGGVEERIVKGINIHFRRAAKTEPNEYYYLDNLKLHQTKTAVEQINMTLNANEILSFDKKWQVGMLSFGSWMAQSMLPNLSTVFLPDAPERGGVLKIDQPEGYGDAKDTGHYMGFEVSEELLSQVAWESYDEDAKLCFDVYAPAQNGIYLVNLELQDDAGRKYYKKDFTIPPDTWTEFKISVKDLNAGRVDVPNSANCFANTNAFIFCYHEVKGPARELYVDNFRMEI